MNSRLHSNFFSSLKQVEKRLKLDSSSNPLTLSPPSAPPQQPPQVDHTLSESLGSPLYLYADQTPNSLANQSSNLEFSEAPVEFLSNSIDFPQTHENPLPKSPKIDTQIPDPVDNDVDEIGLLIELLGLSDFEGGFSNSDTCSSCHCDGGFLDKIVGFKGPKCRKERERLDGWIKHFGEEKIEPFRLAHLLLGKATCITADGDDIDNGIGNGFQGIEFPSTVEEFLQHDPPMNSNKEG